MGSSGCGKTTLIGCLVGVNELDSGEIEIFGEAPRKNHGRIGYMPQEAALVNEFTIREMIWFYGTIFGLSSEKIAERFRFLSDLLELPDESRMIKDCSGGQQRRISFAVALVHEPELLILDEPTVGVDPLLRLKIWTYLVDITRSNNVTVLLSTHYIEEAKHATCVGIMRNGCNIAEDSPQNILESMETTSLEEAFLTLSHKQETNVLRKMELPAYIKGNEYSNRENLSAKHIKIQQSTFKIIKALLRKNYVQIMRNFQ